MMNQPRRFENTVIGLNVYKFFGLQLKDEEVAIVKLDATANDVTGPFDVRGFPTLYWAPKDKKDSPVRYDVSKSETHLFR